MQIYILNPDYVQIGIIEESESILWSPKYNDIGDAEIYIPCNDAYLELLQKGNYLYRYDDEMICKIETVEIETDIENGDYIVATAKDNCNMLSGRIVRWQTVFSGTVARFVERLLNDNVINPKQTQRKIPNFEIDTSNFSELTETIETANHTDDLLQLIISTCKTANYGFRLLYDIERGKHIFKLYKGVNKATETAEIYVEFSPQFSNILSSHYKTDDSNLKNVVYVEYENTAGEKHLLSMFNGDTEPQGESRKEIYVDGTATSRDITIEELTQMFPNVQKTSRVNEEKTTSTYTITEAGESITVATSEGTGDSERITVTDYTYLKLIRAIGTNTLAGHTSTEEFTGDVDTLDTYEYKTDYNLGDVVKVVNEYGMETTARITEILESEDNEDGYNVEPTFEYVN